MEVLTNEGVKTAPVVLVETFNALYGLRVRQFEIWLDSETNREYRVVKAARGDKGKVLVVWRNVPPEHEAAMGAWRYGNSKTPMASSACGYRASKAMNHPISVL
jgi:hypothetical protein